MKDIPQPYDPMVAKILGFNPNGTGDFRRLSLGYDLRPVLSDIGLEFARRMRNLLAELEDTDYNLNSDHLMTTTTKGCTVTRTYYSCLRERSARAQVFQPIQEIIFEKSPDGKHTVTGIHLVSEEDLHPWKEVTVRTRGSNATIEAISQIPVVNLKINYVDQIGDPLVYMNGKKEPVRDCTPNTETGSGFLTYEQYPSSVIVPVVFRAGQVISHLDISPNLLSSPMDSQNTTDKGFHIKKDPLCRGAMVQWAPGL